jgi:hypothetical protein
MKTVNRLLIISVVLLFSAFTFSDVFAGKKIEAVPNKEYRLSETNGPAMILVTTFSGPSGRPEANALVYELRKNFQYKAYIHEQIFEHNLKKEEKLSQSYSGSLKYRKSSSVPSYAVLVGDFQSFDDRDFQATLKEIKRCQPQCMTVNRTTSQDYKNWRSNNAAVSGKGPLYMAFGVTNPLMPPENQQGTVDKLVETMNANSPYSLLKCPRHYTVRIATFTGKIVIKQDEIKEIEAGHRPFADRKTSDLDLAMKAATKMCKILRGQGVEAYEFHDRFASFVTIGSFNSYGQELPNGMIELEPEIAQIMKQFQGKPATHGVQQGITIAYEPVRIAGLECDVQPQIIKIPRKTR